MKIAAILILSSVSLLAQDANLSTVPEQPKTAAQTLTAEQRKLRAEKQKSEDLLKQKPRLVRGGFFHEWFSSEHKTKTFSLKQAADPKNDYKNVYYSPATDHPKGLVLFSLSF